MAMDIKKLAATAKKQGRDFTKTTTGGGGKFVPPAEGPCNLRFVGYFELGMQVKKVKGVEEVKPKVQLVFELSGKAYPPRENGDPIRMTITENLSDNVKANLIKLFNKMNYLGEATTFVELLGNAYRGRVYHTVKGEGDDAVTYANLRNEDGYSITPPVVEMVDDEGNVTTKPVKVAEALTELKAFLWDLPSKEMWDSIYIDGEYEARIDEKTKKVTRAAKSKNVLQELIMSARNWIGSPMQVLLDDGEPDLGDEEETDPEAVVAAAKAAKPKATKAAAKPAAKKEAAPVVEEEDDDNPLASID